MTIDLTQSLLLAHLPVFDRAFFWRLYKPDQYGAGFACEMIDLFIETTVPLVAALDAALDAHDASAAGRLFHQLKGSAGGVGGASLVHLCGRLEELGERTALPDIMDMKMIRDAYLELVTALREEQAHLSGHP